MAANELRQRSKTEAGRPLPQPGPATAATARPGWLDRSLKELLEDERYRAWLTRGALVVAVAAGIYGVAFL